MRGRTDLECRRKEHAHIRLETAKQGRTPRAQTCELHSWGGPRAGTNGIPSSERQVRQGAEYLRSRQNIRRTRLRQGALRGSYIQQIAHAVVVRLESRAVGLAGRFEESDRCLALAKGGAQIRVSGPNLVGDLVALDVRLSFCLVNLRPRFVLAILSSASIEYRPAKIELQFTIQISGMCPGVWRL